MTANPWAHGRNEDEFAEPNYPEAVTSRYAAPSIQSGSPWNDEYGWSPSPRKEPGNTPDPARLGELPLRQHYPTPGRPAEEYYGALDVDDNRRHSVEYQDADGWAETRGYPGYPDAGAGAARWAANPRSKPPAEPRLTNLLAPRTYTFMRPFMTGLAKNGGARRFNGEHFSMADHSRNYEILGMRPATSKRNTYRLEPSPWDTNIVDMPPDNVEPVNAVIQAVDVAYQSRSWRLT